MFAAQPFKLEKLRELDGPISVFSQGAFTDLCAGPHVERTGQVAHVKLLSVSGTNWRGTADGEPMQRIHGTAFPTAAGLSSHLHRLEEAKLRDHRKIGAQMGLFLFHEYSPGAPFWLPRGEVLWHTLATAMRDLLLREGYVAVRTPQVFDRALWETSGHWAHYQRNMFCFHRASDDEGSKHRTWGLKPMNCPAHMLLFGATRRSWRELPWRVHDQGVLHRDEISGALGGLTRVRQLSQDDAHIFCATEQIEDEVVRVLALIGRVYAALGLGFRCRLSTRPEDRLGDDARWDATERALAAALERCGLPFRICEGDGAFYGPKIDVDVFDAIGRPWQCATVQLDDLLPERFRLRFVGPDGADHRPVVIHRAIFGSFERFIGILIEHFAGRFPFWLAPEQVRVLSISEPSAEWAREVGRALCEAGIRATVDDGADRLGAKLRRAHLEKPAWRVIVGERESASQTVELDEVGPMDLDALVTRCRRSETVPI